MVPKLVRRTLRLQRELGIARDGLPRNAVANRHFQRIAAWREGGKWHEAIQSNLFAGLANRVRSFRCHPDLPLTFEQTVGHETARLMQRFIGPQVVDL